MQQINLFVADFAPAPQRFGLHTVVRASVGLLLLLFLIGAFLFQQVHGERRARVELSGKLDEVIQRIRQSQGNEKARQEIGLQLQQLRAQIAVRQSLLTDLQRREARQTLGFAPLLQTLAREHDSRLWLTHIGWHNGQLQLTGETLSAAAVPIWLGRLQNAPPITGLRFDGMQLSRIDDKPGVLAFQLNPVTTTNTGGQPHASAQR